WLPTARRSPSSAHPLQSRRSPARLRRPGAGAAAGGRISRDGRRALTSRCCFELELALELFTSALLHRRCRRRASGDPRPRVGGAVDDNLYRALALKVRALLTGAALAELEPASPAPAPTPQLPSTPMAAAAATETRARVGLELGYHLLFGDSAATLRQGVVL